MLDCNDITHMMETGDWLLPDHYLGTSWNTLYFCPLHFQDILSKLFHLFDFLDVTLACVDGQQIKTHKVILLSSSPLDRTSP